MQTSSLAWVDTGRVVPAPGRSPPSCHQSTREIQHICVDMCHLAASTEKKREGQVGYRRSPEWGHDLLHGLVTCWKTAGKHQTTTTPASKVLPCSGCAEMKVGNWTQIKDGFWFRPIFVACDTFENNSLVVLVESTERVNIYVPFLNLCPVLLILFLMYKDYGFVFIAGMPAGVLHVDGLKKLPPSFFLIGGLFP